MNIYISRFSAQTLIKSASFSFFSVYTIDMLPTHNELIADVKARNVAMNWLIKNYPNSFDLCNRRPLKPNIIEDILAEQKPEMPTKSALVCAYQYYTDWGSYLNALLEGAECIDLNGEPFGKVSKEHMEAAQAQLKAAQQKLQA